MQVGLLNGEPKHDLRGVIERINRLAAKVRERSGLVFMQHCSGASVFDAPAAANRGLASNSSSRTMALEHAQ